MKIESKFAAIVKKIFRIFLRNEVLKLKFIVKSGANKKSDCGLDGFRFRRRRRSEKKKNNKKETRREKISQVSVENENVMQNGWQHPFDDGRMRRKSSIQKNRIFVRMMIMTVQKGFF